jgi:DNA-binding PadR family transcriptional regulator
MVDVITSFLQGLDRPLILWLIGQKPKHGYELMTEMKRLTGRKLKPSTLYPLLSWLEAEGYVAGVWVEQGRRSLKRYSITSEGKALLGKVTSLLNKPLRRVIEDLLGERTEKGESYLSLKSLENSFAST